MLAFLSANQLDLLTGTTPAGPTRIRSVSHAAQLLAGKRARLDGRRVGVLHSEPGAADALAQTLRQRGAQVAVLSLDPRQLTRLEALDPEVIVLEPHQSSDVCFQALRAVVEHPLLRWACVLLSAPEQIAADGLEAHDLSELSAQVQLLCADYDAAVVRARNADSFFVALEALGPARVLRLLVQSGKSWRVQFTTPMLTMEVDIAQDLLVGARGALLKSAEHPLLGTDALNVLLREVRGSVHARTVARPAVTNIMGPLDAALAGAQHGVVRASVTPARASVRPARPSTVPKRSLPAPAALSSGVRKLLSRTLVDPPGTTSGSPTPAAATTSAPPAAAAAEPSVRSSQAPTRAWSVRAQADNDNDEVQRFARSSLQPTTFTDPLKPSEPQSEPAAPSEAKLAPLPARRSRKLATKLGKPLVGALTSALVLFGLLALHAPTEVTSTALGPPLPAPTQTARQPLRAPPEPAPLAPAPLAPALTTVSAPLPSAVPAPSEVPAVVPTATSEPGPTPAQVEAVPVAVAALDGSASAPQVPKVELAPSPKLSPLALRARDRRASALARRGTFLLRRHQLDKAARAFESALQLAALNPLALTGRTRLALEQHDAAAALAYASSLVTARPKSANGQLLLGDAQVLAHDLSAARRAWRKASELGQPLARARLRSWAGKKSVPPG